MALFRPERPHVLDADGRQDVVQRLSRALASDDRVRAAWLFGSFSRGEPFRDVDVGVLFAEPLRTFEEAELSNRLWDALGGTPYDLDVVALNGAAPRFQLKVVDGGRLLCEHRPGLAVEFAVRAESEIADFLEAMRAVEAEAEARRGA
jgi:predicted nucleotidyltransferase